MQAKGISSDVSFISMRLFSHYSDKFFCLSAFRYRKILTIHTPLIRFGTSTRSTNECIKTHSEYSKHLPEHWRIILIRFCFSHRYFKKGSSSRTSASWIYISIKVQSVVWTQCIMLLACICIRRILKRIIMLNVITISHDFSYKIYKLLLFYHIVKDKNEIQKSNTNMCIKCLYY